MQNQTKTEVDNSSVHSKLTGLSSLRENGFRGLKTIVYALQALLVFIAWILALVVLTKSGTTGSASKFYFTLTWMCIPAFLYLAVVPLWPRTQRFVNAYVTAAVDVSFTIFWLAAFCAVQVWTDSGANSSQGCAAFAFGSQSKCQVGYATVVFGVMIFVLWLVPSSISVHNLICLHRHGSMPSTKPEISKPIFDETRSTWSLRPGAQGRGVGNPQTRLDRGRLDEEHGSVHTETEEGTHPGRALSYGQDPPLTAPPTYTQSGLPQWKNIHYGDRTANEPQTARHVSPPVIHRPGPGRYASPPRLEIHPPRPDILSPRNPFVRDGTSSATLATGRAGFDTLRGMPRVPVPGPASRHLGGYTSAHHTPLPAGMTPKKNSWQEEQGVRSPEDRGRLVFPEADYSRAAAVRAW
ncbi:hypothetical protein MMC32_003773 [Xylographa parallela]|nr:hypothetical protein [Xylographa parallela]